MLVRWKYRFISWFFDRPDALHRRLVVEDVLLRHAKDKTSPTPKECKALALKLGVSTWWH